MNYQETSMDKFTSSDGTEFDIHLWEPANPKIVLLSLHGALAHAGDYVNVGKYFMQHSFVTVAYDLRGHKQKKAHVNSYHDFIKDTDDFLKWIKTKYQDLPIIVVGHSFGALLASILSLTDWESEDSIRGYIMSSPYYRNKVKISPLVIKMSGFLSKIIPKVKAPIEDITDKLTNDDAIYQRHRDDESKDIRASQLTIRFGHEMMKSQNWVSNNIHNWSHPALFLISGDDFVADSSYTEELINNIDSKFIDIIQYPENYHENFNEINREEVFEKMLNWITKLSD